MAYTFATLLSDVLARGYAQYNDAGPQLAMVKRMINDSARDIDGMYQWGYRETTATGTPPMAITDLGQIQAVTNVTGPYTLVPRDRRDLRQEYGDLTTAGTAVFYYITGGSTINVYPVQAGLTLTVDYWKTAPDMTADGDLPLMPDRYRRVIVEQTVIKLARLRQQDPVVASATQERDAIVAQMINELGLPQLQASQDYVGLVGDDC